MNDNVNDNTDAHRTRRSRSYEKARTRAEEYIQSPDRLHQLVDDARQKAAEKKDALDDVWASLMACIRLIKAYANGSYRQVSWQSLLMIVASVVYFVMPVDLMPDFIVMMGLFDDAALMGWTARTFKKEIDAFVDWEKGTDD
ncbi:MAG: YkvA family protein [Thermodesulfobacteriota bacterium]|nr:YkvA family protein [Thermodesulfobacteriota bacterium]